MKTNIAIIGESCIDEYVYGTCDRVCPEASALCFKNLGHKTTNPGMAGNVYENIKKLNVYNHNISLITSSSTIIKRRFIDKKYNTIIFREDVNDTTEQIDLSRYDFSIYDSIVFSDYCKGFLSEDSIINICKQKKTDCIVFIDTKKSLLSISKYVDFIKINDLELQQNIKDLPKIVLDTNLIVTKGEDGAVLYNKKYTDKKYKTNKVLLRDVCGAGDTFLASLAISYINDQNIDNAIDFANQCSSKVVSQFGVVTI